MAATNTKVHQVATSTRATEDSQITRSSRFVARLSLSSPWGSQQYNLHNIRMLTCFSSRAATLPLILPTHHKAATTLRHRTRRTHRAATKARLSPTTARPLPATVRRSITASPEARSRLPATAASPVNTRPSSNITPARRLPTSNTVTATSRAARSVPRRRDTPSTEGSLEGTDSISRSTGISSSRSTGISSRGSTDSRPTRLDSQARRIAA